MAHMTKSWINAKDKTTDREFARYLRELVRPAQIAYARLMTKHSDPSGIEYRHRKDEERWAFVLADASEPGARIQFFDTFGFSGHQHYASLDEAVQEMVGQGFHIEDAGALDRIAATPRWAEGIAWMDMIIKQSSKVAA